MSVLGYRFHVGLNSQFLWCCAVCALVVLRISLCLSHTETEEQRQRQRPPTFQTKTSSVSKLFSYCCFFLHFHIIPWNFAISHLVSLFECRRFRCGKMNKCLPRFVRAHELKSDRMCLRAKQSLEMQRHNFNSHIYTAEIMCIILLYFIHFCCSTIIMHTLEAVVMSSFLHHLSI